MKMLKDNIIRTKTSDKYFMKNTVALIKQDIKFQMRHGFYLAYTAITIMYIILLSFLPEQTKPMATTFIVFTDPSALGFFFIGGIILLEKGQNIFDQLFVTPLLIRDYLFSKVSSLGLISVLTSVIIHASIFGWSHITVLFVVGVLLTSTLFTLIGIGVAVRCHSLNGFFLVSPLYALIFCLPLLSFFNIYDSILFYIFPTQASLIFMLSPFEAVAGQIVVPLLVVMLSWIVAAYLWAEASFRKHIVMKMGG